VSEPAFWRVTLTWPRPPDFGKPRANGYLPYQFDHPHAFFRNFAMQLQPGELESAEMRARTVRIVARIAASKARPRVACGSAYTSSAQIAIDAAIYAAWFGFCVNGAYNMDMALPEPVRITVEPVTANPEAAATAAREE
jgi:hypothetical protein